MNPTAKTKKKAAKPIFNVKCSYHIGRCKCSLRFDEQSRRKAQAGAVTSGPQISWSSTPSGRIPALPATSNAALIKFSQIDAGPDGESAPTGPHGTTNCRWFRHGPDCGVHEPCTIRLLEDFYCSRLTLIKSPTATRIGLGGLWTGSTLPHQMRNSAVVMSHIANWLPPLSNAQERICDALGLFELAAKSHDQRILLTATMSYVSSMELLRRDLECGQANLFNLQVVAHQAMMCEMFELPFLGSQGWKVQLKGIMAMENASNPELLYPTFGRVMKRATKWYCLLGGLYFGDFLGYDTSGQEFAHPTWNAVGSQCDELLHLGLRIPPSRSRLTQYLRHTSLEPDSAHANLNEMLQQAKAIDTDLKAWLARCYETKVLLPYTLNPLDEIDSKTAFPNTNTKISFESFLAAHCHTLYWICSLSLQTHIIDILDLISKPSQPSSAQTTLSTAHDRARTYATLLCQSTEYFSSQNSASTSHAMAVSAPLYFAQQWYIHSGDEVREAWCRQATARARGTSKFRNWEVTILWHFFGALWFAEG